MISLSRPGLQPVRLELISTLDGAKLCACVPKSSYSATEKIHSSSFTTMADLCASFLSHANLMPSPDRERVSN